MRIYISGPMQGYPRWNFDAFDAAERKWRDAGHKPISPANINRALGFDFSDDRVDDEFIRRAIKIDMEIITGCDAIALLPGWEKSSGVAVELSLALYLGLGVYDAVTMQPYNTKSLRQPWIKKEQTNALEI